MIFKFVGKCLFAGAIAFTSLHSQAEAIDPVRYVLPKPKRVQSLGGKFHLTDKTKFKFVGKSTAEDQHTLDLLNKDLRSQADRGSSDENAILFERLPNWSEGLGELGEEGYTIEVSTTTIRASATTARGLFYAAQTLIQMVDRSSRATEIHGARIVDWPDVRDRMVLYDFRFDNVNLEYVKRWIRELSRLKINQFMFFLSGDYVYEKYPFVATPEKLTREKIRALKAYAIAHHVTLIPQVESLGHAEGALKHEQFKDIRLGETNTYAYSPCTERTYSVLGDFYSELSKEFDQADLFHVGGDEVWNFYQDPRCHELISEKGEEYLYSMHMQKLSGLLQPLGRRMAIWSDMILKHPKAAEGISRDTVIFDWDYSEDYQRYDDFPSLLFFKEKGFKNIYATAAVLGFNDIYPMYQVAFQNIRGFTQYALKKGIKSVCVTIWEMQPGNNAEVYLYGLAWAGHITWSSQATDVKDFNRRYASMWFGIRDATADFHVDRAYWFPWRLTGSSNVKETDVKGYWQKEHHPGGLLYQKFDVFVAEQDAKELRRQPVESATLLKRLEVQAKSIGWLETQRARNEMTTQSMWMTNAFYRYLAKKVGTMSRLALDYRAAFDIKDNSRMVATLSGGIQKLEALKSDLPKLRAHLLLAINERNRHPEELKHLAETEQSLVNFQKKIKVARDDLARGTAPPIPKDIGL